MLKGNICGLLARAFEVQVDHEAAGLGRPSPVQDATPACEA